MNDNIRAIWNQAASSHQQADTSRETQENFLNRFAELIVRECVRYFNEDYQRDFDTLWREDLTKGIREHFGVKE